MKEQFEMLRKTRKSLLDLVSDLTIEQLNEVPTGFNNNIAWNLAHLIAAQQGVCYLRSGNKMIIDEALFANYKPGTKPEDVMNQEELEHIKGLFLSTIDQFETDYNNQLISNYTPWTTRYGAELNSIEEATTFLLYHEGLHLGYIMALKRLVAVKENV
ncbi:DinB family protein [Solitalea sp. MAHUQ-68]|uniref:DinB family protein n=1 Tax=Solitalea agri TaxID=2953739 RepID=A0A9X2F2B1_9SPHI|nr:DinB family protein [Solitalea agri]MCO4293369.1 DinB family protein [Solitalea agri]